MLRNIRDKSEMKTIYLIIDINAKLDPADALEFLGDISDYLGISEYLFFCTAPSYRLKSYKGNKDTVLNEMKAKKWKEISFQEDMQKGHEIFVDKTYEKQYQDEQQTLFSKFKSLEPKFDSMCEQKIPLSEIIEKMGLHDFLFFMRNFYLTDMQFQYSTWIRESLCSIPTDEYKKLVTKIQNYQVKNDLSMRLLKTQEIQLFDFSIDLNLNIIKLKIIPLLGKTEEELLKFLAESVNHLQEIYPQISGYLDANVFQGSIQTPHEDVFNIHDKAYVASELLLRGYTRYSWINNKQYQALGGDNAFAGVDGLRVNRRGTRNCVELLDARYENYVNLKKIFRPLLSKGEYTIDDQSILEQPLMLNTVISDTEFEIIDELSSTADDYENLSWINIFTYMMTINKIKKYFGEEAIEGVSDREQHRCIRRFFNECN